MGRKEHFLNLLESESVSQGYAGIGDWISSLAVSKAIDMAKSMAKEKINTPEEREAIVEDFLEAANEFLRAKMLLALEAANDALGG